MKVNIANQEFTTTFLSNKGLSMTDAQSISNFCNQQALEIERILNSANTHEKSFFFGTDKFYVTEGKSLPADTLGLLIEKSTYHACQAWLMEALKEKDNLLLMVKQEPFVYFEEKPKEPEYLTVDLLKPVKLDSGMLSYVERLDYLRCEAFASHLGQFIHKGGKLDKLRRETSEEVKLEFVDMGNGRLPVKVTRNHNGEWLLNLHNELSRQHREYEKKVNYYKALLKNAENSQNSEREELNANRQREIQLKNDILNKDYREAYEKWAISRNIAETEYEKKRYSLLRKISELKIIVEPKFQNILDEFNKK